MFLYCTTFVMFQEAIFIQTPERNGGTMNYGSASMDLLGLNSPTNDDMPNMGNGIGYTSQPQATGSDMSSLLDVFGSPTQPPSTEFGNDVSSPPGQKGGVQLVSEANIKKYTPLSPRSPFDTCLELLKFYRFVFRNSGIVFENEAIQIGVKSQFSPAQTVGQVELYYGNKSTMPLTNFNVQVQNAESSSLLIQAQDIGPVVQISAQVKQQFNVKCVSVFSVTPTARISFLYVCQIGSYLICLVVGC